MVVLHELQVEAGRLAERAPVVGLEEEPARIPENLRLEHQDFRNRGALDLH
jgi:hypothetical protein